MMIMFVLFAALLAAKMMQPDIEIRYRAAPVPQINDVEVEKPVDRPVLSRQPSLRTTHAAERLRSQSRSSARNAVAQCRYRRARRSVRQNQCPGPDVFRTGAGRPAAVRDFLDRLAAVIAQTPHQIHVVDHTDDNPINPELFPSHWDLSLVRASRVARHRISASTLDPARFVVLGREPNPVRLATKLESFLTPSARHHENRSIDEIRARIRDLHSAV
jgi:flagellar motor protein MotB